MQQQQSRLSVVRHRSEHQQQRTTAGLCECLKQPRRIWPSSDNSKNYDMVETKPRRFIRVLHELPSTTTTKKKENAKGKRGSNITSLGNNGNTVRLRAYECDATEPAVWEGVNGNSSLIVTAEINGQDDDEEEVDVDEQETIGTGESSVYARRSVRVYDFESPFHPKNRVQYSDETLLRLKVLADRLVHSILDRAFSEYVVLVRNDVKSDCDSKESDKCNGELGNGHVVRDETNDSKGIWSFGDDDSSWDSDFAIGSNKFSMNLNPSFANGFELGLKNPGFHSSNSLEMSSSFLKHSGRYSSGRRPVPSASSPDGVVPNSYSSSKRFTVMGGLTSNSQGLFDGDGIAAADMFDPFENFTYSPTGGDDASSQVGSSLQSSTWGSSTDSSLRYVRRFMSKKFKTKPLLLFIHGIGDSADLWRTQLDFFKQRGYETVAMDLIGHGLSCAPSEAKAYHFHNILSDVLAIFDRYSKERNVVIGHSYGACFAAALARHRSKQVTHLVLLSGGGPFPLCAQPSKLNLPHCLTSCLQSCMSCKSRRRKTYYMPPRKQTRFVSSLDIPSYVLQNISKGQVWLEGDASFHKQISVPTLLVYGLRDPFITLVEECEMEKTIPRAFLELIPEASHMLMLDAPDEVNDMIYKFLRRWDR